MSLERITQNKNYIEKVMFLVAVARPRYAVDGTETVTTRWYKKKLLP
jgi:hypothetical protein